MRTECTTKSITLSSLRRQKLRLEFDGGRITSDAGALLLREADRQLKLVRRLSACIPDPRDPDLIEHQQRTLLSQRIMGIACGWEDLNDHQTLRDDPLWQILTNRGVDSQKPVASGMILIQS
ncbi:MAG: transposase [Phycisphaerae bacterium]